MVSLSILSVGFALAPVCPDAVGGAEQVLSALDRALVAAGHRSLVVAPEGSLVAGSLIATAKLPAHITEDARAAVERRQCETIEQVLSEQRIDLIHAHGLDFAEHLPETDVPTLITLHLPAEFYRPEALAACSNTWFHCVSADQRRRFPPLPNMLDPIPNGVPVDRLLAHHARRDFALALGRICPEKGFHLALDAARLAGTTLLLAGQVFPYDTHQQYFIQEIRPRLGPSAQFLGPVGFARKRRLLTAARCLLIPSLVPETSSLVAMEALACGCPVIAFPAGALTDLIEPGVTGCLVSGVEEMAAAISLCDDVDRERCRDIARQRFPLDAMIAAYFHLYRFLGAGQSRR